jgi:murein DD-endopeptidase MepM/ murein hydrolase activator NlpD
MLDISGDASIEFSLGRVGDRRVPCGVGPDAGNRVLSLLSRPFGGVFPLTNYFDHSLPLQFEDADGYQVTGCDERVVAAGRVDGHNGYDWLLPSGTPVVAAAEGQVIFAGADPPFACPPLGRTVSGQLAIEIKHPAMSGEEFSSVYVHLSRIDVVVGQSVSRAQTVGLSGNTGCSTTPHLHFHVWRFTHTNSGRPTRVDPYGWDGRRRDPWEGHPSGAESIWLWRPGEAPPLH